MTKKRSANSALTDSIEQKRSEFQSRLQEGEKLLCVSPNAKRNYAYLTDRRLVIENAKGTTNLDLKEILRVQGFLVGGGKTDNAADMYIVKLKTANKKYSLTRYSYDHFVELVTELKKLTPNAKWK